MAGMSRRTWLRNVAAMPLAAAAPSTARAARSTGQPQPYDSAPLPPGIRSRVIAGVNGIAMHVLDAGYEPAGRPGLLLIHGFPELAYSWRKVLPPLADAGYHVFAPDLRGYGRSGGTDVQYDDDLAPFSTLNRVGPRRSGILFALNAPIAALLGWLVLGEALSVSAVAGIAVTAMGVFLAIIFG